MRTFNNAARACVPSASLNVTSSPAAVTYERFTAMDSVLILYVQVKVFFGLSEIKVEARDMAAGTVMEATIVFAQSKVGTA